MKITLAHDSFTQLGGAERVVEAFHELYPQAPVFTVVADKQLRAHFSTWQIKTTVLQWLYNLYPHFQHLFPFIPVALFLQPAIKGDLLLSSSSSFAKGFKVSASTKHVNYCHTPTRFVWTDTQHAYNEIAAPLRPLAKVYFRWLRRWDYKAAQKVHHFIANSKEVQKRIKTFYNKDSAIIYPFIDVNFWQNSQPKKDYFLIAGRLQRAKNFEVVVRVFNQLQLPLHVVGAGRYEKYLRSIAGPTVTFFGRVSDETLRDQYSGAKAFIFPPLEDFGIMPLEAASCGTATIGLAQGGSLETVIPGVTGELLAEMTEQALTEVISQWNSEKYQTERLQAHAAKFSKEIFETNIQEFINQAMQ